jgi:hypothetical protein
MLFGISQKNQSYLVEQTTPEREKKWRKIKDSRDS